MIAQVKAPTQVAVPVEITIPATMTAAWFDPAVARSFEKDIVVKPLGQGRYAMRSSRDSSLTYMVTATSCQCEGFQHYHRCYHICRAAFEDACTGPEPSAPAARPVKELVYGLDNGQYYIVTFAADGTVSGRVSATRPAATIGQGQRCPWCGGDGLGYRGRDGAYFVVDCRNCGGSGYIPTDGPRTVARVRDLPGKPVPVAA